MSDTVRMFFDDFKGVGSNAHWWRRLREPDTLDPYLRIGASLGMNWSTEFKFPDYDGSRAEPWNSPTFFKPLNSPINITKARELIAEKLWQINTPLSQFIAPRDLLPHITPAKEMQSAYCQGRRHGIDAWNMPHHDSSDWKRGSGFAQDENARGYYTPPHKRTSWKQDLAAPPAQYEDQYATWYRNYDARLYDNERFGAQSSRKNIIGARSRTDEVESSTSDLDRTMSGKGIKSILRGSATRIDEVESSTRIDEVESSAVHDVECVEPTEEESASEYWERLNARMRDERCARLRAERIRLRAECARQTNFGTEAISNSYRTNDDDIDDVVRPIRAADSDSDDGYEMIEGHRNHRQYIRDPRIANETEHASKKMTWTDYYTSSLVRNA